jgi:hypothetical protein
MRKPVIIGLLVAIGISMMASCKHELPVNPNPVVTPTTDTGICFDRDILPIFISGCAKAGCHDANSAQEGYKLTDYSNIVKKGVVAGNPSESKLYKVIIETSADKRMPQPPNPALTAAQQEMIRRWIAEGAKNTTGCTVACDSNNYKYSTAIKPLLDKYCNGCHNSQAPSGGYVLDVYDEVKKLALYGNLLGAIKHEFGYSAMPQGGAKLSDCEIAQVQKWIADGVPNN